MDKEILEKILHSHKSIENIKWINPDKVSGFSDKDIVNYIIYKYKKLNKERRYGTYSAVWN